MSFLSHFPLKRLRLPFKPFFTPFFLFSNQKAPIDSKTTEVVSDYDVNPEKGFKFAYEGISDHLDQSGKLNYKPSLGRKYKRQIQRKQLADFKDMLRAKAEDELKGIKREVVLQKDEVWGDEAPPERKFDRIINKEFYWISRDENYYEDSERRISYLKEFTGPFFIKYVPAQQIIDKIVALTPKNAVSRPSLEYSLEEYYLSNPEIMAQINELKNMLFHIPHSEYPNLALALTYRLRLRKDENFGIWDKFKVEIDRNLHLYTLIELSKLKHALGGVYPKRGSILFHNACLDIVRQEHKNTDIYELMHLYHAFRLQPRDHLHSTMLKEIKERKDEILNLLKKDPDVLANLFYTYANSRIKKQNRKKIRPQREEVLEAEELVNLFFDTLLHNIKNMSTDGVVRFLLSMSLMRLDNHQDILMRIEKRIIPSIEQFDAFQVCEVLYALSKFSDGKAEGTLAIYDKLASMIPKFWSSYGHRQKSRLFFSFTARGYNSTNLPHYQTLFYPWIKDSILSFTHSELANVMLGLMFLENQEEEIWKAVVKNISKQPYVVPMPHFFTHKMALYYLDGVFPDWNLDGLHAAMRFGEDYFSTMRLKKYQTSETFMELYRVLHFKLNLNAKPQLEWENLFVVDFAILPQKVGIYLITPKDLLPDSREPRPLFKLKKFIMEKSQWGIYLCDWEEFLRQGENKLSWLFNDFMKVYKKRTVDWVKEESTETDFSRERDLMDRSFNYIDREKTLKKPYHEAVFDDYMARVPGEVFEIPENEEVSSEKLIEMYNIRMEEKKQEEEKKKLEDEKKKERHEKHEKQVAEAKH